MNAVMISRNVTARRSWRGLLLLIAVSLALAVMVDQLPKIAPALSAHAIARHGEDANQAKQCLDDQRPHLDFWNPSLQRFGRICWLDGDRWGIVIRDSIVEPITGALMIAGVITAFVTTKLKTTERMRRYMERQGYRET